MKSLFIKYISKKGKEAINEIIEKTKDEYNNKKISPAQKAIYELFEFQDGIIKINAIDPSKMIIIKMFIKPSFKKMLKKEDCKLNIDFKISVEGI